MTETASTPQPVLSGLTPAAIFLVATLDEDGAGTVRSVLGGLADLVADVTALVPGSGLNVVAGIGSDAYDAIVGGERPAGLHVLAPIVGPTHSSPSTPGDLLFHIRASRMDACWELAGRLGVALGSSVTVIDEVHGFGYLDKRAVIGFVDGTANPTGSDAVAAVFGDSAQTYVIVQKYLHDMAAWNALPVDEQERVIGRTKADDIEFPDDVKPSNSHVAANELVDPDGTEHEIVRFNMPFGRAGAGEVGTFFIGYAADPGVIEQMLTNMFIGRPPGNHDRLLDFATAVTGTLFYVPSAAELATLSGPIPGGPDDPLPPVPSAVADLTDDTSLRIGSLKHLLRKAGP